MQLNKVQLIGNITKDPDIKVLPSGIKVCSFSMATNEVFVKDGVKQEKVEFHNIVSFGKTAENIAKYMVKGSQIYVEGKLQTRSWEADGIKKYRTEILANNVQFGSSPKTTEKKETVSDIDIGGYDGEIVDTVELEGYDIPF